MPGWPTSTPASRNRVVDLLRAAAILVVVLGHWTVAAVYVDDTGTLRRGDLLELATWTHPLTWLVQVMPVFFLVGGYSNALSWRSACARGTTYGGWLRARLRRLTIPVLPLMVFWAVVAPVAHALGASGETLRIASRASLVPTWFLAAYVVVVSLAPLTLRLWERWGWTSVVGGLALGGLVDYVSITNDVLLLGFLNYLVVWGAVHQLGYAWLDGSLAGTGRRLALAAVGLVGPAGPGPVRAVRRLDGRRRRAWREQRLPHPGHARLPRAAAGRPRPRSRAGARAAHRAASGLDGDDPRQQPDHDDVPVAPDRARDRGRRLAWHSTAPGCGSTRSPRRGG